MEGKKIFIVLALVAMAASLEIPDLSKFTTILSAVKGEGMPPFISLTRKMVHLGPW